MESDYFNLSQQYANFLVAVGGVSITALAVVLTLGTKSVKGAARLSGGGFSGRHGLLFHRRSDDGRGGGLHYLS